MKLPTFEEAAKIVNSDKDDPIAEFIYDNEPAGVDESKLFRAELIKAFNKVSTSKSLDWYYEQD